MDFGGLAAYAAALAALTAAPGPIIAVLVARALARDSRGAIAFAAGLCLGDGVAVAAVALGGSFWAASAPDWLALAEPLGVAYLLWLAIGLWRGSGTDEAAAQRPRGWLAAAAAGLAVCLGNPATVLIYVVLLPAIVPHGTIGGTALPLLLAVTCGVVGAVYLATILLSRQVQRLMASAAASSLFGRVTAAVIGITSLWMLVS